MNWREILEARSEPVMRLGQPKPVASAEDFAYFADPSEGSENAAPAADETKVEFRQGCEENREGMTTSDPETSISEAGNSYAKYAKHPRALDGDSLPLEAVLKGTAIELWSDVAGERLWLVADEEDARKVGEPRGSVYTADEARRVVQISDPVVVQEIQKYKRVFNGRVIEFRKREQSIGKIPVKIGRLEGQPLRNSGENGPEGAG